MAGRIQTIRIGVSEAAHELGCDHKTLSGALKSQGFEPGKDGKFSMLQIFHARFGDQEAETLLLTRAKRETAEEELKKTRGELIPVVMVTNAWESIVVGVRQKLLGLPSKLQSRLGLTEGQVKIISEEIDEILTDQAREPDYNAKEKEQDENDI